MFGCEDCAVGDSCGNIHPCGVWGSWCRIGVVALWLLPMWGDVCLCRALFLVLLCHGCWERWCPFCSFLPLPRLPLSFPGCGCSGGCVAGLFRLRRVVLGRLCFRFLLAGFFAAFPFCPFLSCCFCASRVMVRECAPVGWLGRASSLGAFGCCCWLYLVCRSGGAVSYRRGFSVPPQLTSY